MNPIQTVARKVLVAQLEDVANLWEDYPDLGEWDWEAVVEEVKRIADDLAPDEGNYERAYAQLAARAENDFEAALKQTGDPGSAFGTPGIPD